MTEAVAVPPATPEERRAALALLEAMIPGAPGVPAAGEATLRALEAAAVAELPPVALTALRKAEQALSAAAILSTGRPFHALDADAQEAMLQRWARDPVLRAPYSVLALVYKFVHFDRREVYDAMGGRPLHVVSDLDRPRWLAQVHRGDEWPEGETVACDVVVVGTGAGGAVVGRELAEKGYAVAFVEEGEHHRRDAFTGSSMNAHARFYRAVVSVGNAAMPVMMGRLVGGSTAINGGTCFRTPPWVLDRWCDALGTDDFSPPRMARWFERVEETLQVAPTDDKLLGPMLGVVERGAKKLGWSLSRIKRNAPGCDASGFCDFGCRTDARRSTNLSYIPPALRKGAVLFTGLRAEHVRVENGRATGLDAVTAKGHRVRFHAKAVVLAGGSIPTPLLLQKQGICNGSGQVGRNLTLHPSGGMSGLFDDELRGAKHVPQGFVIDQFLRENILLLAAQSDRNITPVSFPMAGRRLMDALAQADHIATFGTLIADDRPGGVVRFERDGRALVTYNLTPMDVRNVHRAMVLTGELLLASGAKRLYPVVTSTPVVERDDFHRFAKSVPDAGDLPLVSYHPLGTCKMGRDPRTSVVDLEHQTHEVKRLFIADGSVIQGPLGVNSQVTVMAVATRAAERIADVLG